MKLIFFDIDGTLIGEKDHFMPESTKEAIAKARANGHVCMVNTGRTDRLVRNWLPKLLDFDGYLMGCGTMVAYHDQILLHNTFDKKTGLYIMEGLNKYKIDALLEGVENIYFKEPDKMYTKTFHDYVLGLQNRGFGPFEEAPGKFDKFYCFADERSSIEGFMEEYKDILDAVDREKGFFEIVPKNFSKASGMRFMADYLNISMEDTVAVGDSNNDLPMMEAAGCAIAMGKSSEQVLKIADFVTDTVEKDGIYKAMEWLGII